MMVELEFSIKNQKLKRLDKNTIINKTRNYVHCSFQFETKDWEQLDKYIIIKDEEGHNYLFDLDEEDPTITVPEIILYGGFFKVTVFGFDDDIRLTTDTRTVVLKPSGYTTDISPIDEGGYSKDVFEEFINKIDSTVEVDINDLLNSLIEHIRGA